MRTTFYQNRLGFIKDMTKTFWCVFWFTVYIISSYRPKAVRHIPMGV